MDKYTVEILRVVLASKTNFLVNRMKEKIQFSRIGVQKNIAYEWFEVFPDNMDITLGGVDYSNGSWGSDFIKSAEIFGEDSDIFLDETCTELFFTWFAQGFMAAGGHQLADTYLMSYHDSPRYFALNPPHWITKEEFSTLRCKNKTTELKHITGLVFNFPCFYTDMEEQDEDEEYGEHDIRFYHNKAYYTLKIRNEFYELDPVFDQNIPVYIQNSFKKYLESWTYIRSEVHQGIENIEITRLTEYITHNKIPTTSFLIRDKVSGKCFKYMQMYWVNEEEEQLFSICFECEEYIENIHHPVFDALITLPV